MKAYELLPRLKYLVMTEENGRLSWIGTPQDWDKVEQEVMEYEN